MSEAATTTSTVSLAIDGMISRTCVGRVERALSDVPAVLSVAVRLDSESARVELGDMHTEAAAIAAVEALLAATAGAGFAAHLRGYEGPPIGNTAGSSSGTGPASVPTSGAAAAGPAANHVSQTTSASRSSVGRNESTGSWADDALDQPEPAVHRRSWSDDAEAGPAQAPEGHSEGVSRDSRKLDPASDPSPSAPREAGEDDPDQEPEDQALSQAAPGRRLAELRAADRRAAELRAAEQRAGERRPRRQREDRESPPAYAARIEPGFASEADTDELNPHAVDSDGLTEARRSPPRPSWNLPGSTDAQESVMPAERVEAVTETAIIETAADGADVESVSPAHPAPDFLARDSLARESLARESLGRAPLVPEQTAATRDAMAPVAARPDTPVVRPLLSRLVEPGRVSLSGRIVILSCTVLTLFLLLPTLTTALGVSFAISPSLQFALATVVLLLCAPSVAGSAWRALADGRPGIDLLAVTGAIAAWLLSLWMWREAQPASALYFGTAAGIATLALAGQYFVYRTRRKAQDTLDQIAEAQPEEVTRIVAIDADGSTDGRDSAADDLDLFESGRPLQERLLQIDDLAGGEVIMIRPGERIPADATVLDGESRVDESLLTGDVTPVQRTLGDPIFAGTLNGTGRLFARVERVGPQTTLARVLTRIEDAQTSQTAIERKVERIIGWLVPAVILVAVLTGAFWLWQGVSTEVALGRAITVLIVAFPCALGLAAPAALIAGTGAAARSGILVRDASVIEALPAIRTVAFEQVGSLTEGRPGVREILPAPGIDRESLLAVAVAIEGESKHPLARAVTRFADSADAPDPALHPAVAPGDDVEGLARQHPSSVLQVEAEAVRPIDGAGIEGRVRFPGSADDEAVPVFIGSEALMLQQGVDLTPLSDELELARNEGWTISLVAMARPDTDPMLLGALLFADTPRAGARNAVEALRKAGIAPVMLSPEPTNAARSTGATLGIEETVGELAPRGVDGWIQRAREAGRGVAMVGDPLEDAETLDTADLGIAMSRDAAGRDAAIDSAPLALMRNDVRLVPAAFDIGRRTHGNLRQNLGWALVFNAIGIPLAAAGVLSPIAAILAVGAGIVCVQANALRLGQWRPDPEIAPF